MKNTVNVDEKLVGRIREALAENEEVVFATKKDLIAILPEAMRAIFVTLLLLMIAYAIVFSNLPIYKSDLDNSCAVVLTA